MSADTVYTGKALRSVGRLNVTGEALVTKNPIMLLGFVDPKTGKITQEDHDLNGEIVTGKIFVFPRGVGSTVGPYTLLNLVKNDKGPLAIINRESDQGTVAGCSVSKIPMAYGMSEDPTDVIKTGDMVTVELRDGESTIKIHK